MTNYEIVFRTTYLQKSKMAEFKTAHGVSVRPMYFDTEEYIVDALYLKYEYQVETTTEYETTKGLTNIFNSGDYSINDIKELSKKFEAIYHLVSCHHQLMGGKPKITLTMKKHNKGWGEVEITLEEAENLILFSEEAIKQRRGK